MVTLNLFSYMSVPILLMKESNVTKLIDIEGLIVLIYIVCYLVTFDWSLMLTIDVKIAYNNSGHHGKVFW